MIDRKEIITDHKIILTGNTKKPILVDAEDYPLLSRYNWGETATGYAYHSCHVLRITMHRLIMNPSKHYVIDHINHDTLDNRKCNLRVCTLSQNQMNRRKTNGKSKYKGVSWKTGMKKWMAYISVEGKQKTLGYFKNEEDAAMAYNMAAEKYYGQYALTNKLVRELLAQEASEDYLKPKESILETDATMNSYL